MAHILRLHPNGANTNTDWLPCQPYGANVISQIVAPNGATARDEITSIPSPFARIALVKKAFDEVVRSGNLAGNTIYHKMVSDALDVAEIFFNFDKLKNLFKIVVWDTKTELNAIQQTHPQVYNTLDIFIKQDAPVFNFDRMQRLYILVYNGPNKKTELDVVGATSPASLFFTPANDLSYISSNVSFGQDHPFDGEYQPLDKRDGAFIEYIYAFRNGYTQGNFAQDFPEVNDYLDMSYRLLSTELKNVVSNIPANALNNYSPLQFGTGNVVEILGNIVHKKPIGPVRKSDFSIQHSRYNASVLPLVLPVDPGNQYANWYYVQGPWGSTNHAPYFDNTPWDKRVLPNDGTPHPYLTINDFLEDTIFLCEHKANTKDFFFAEFDDASKCITLPLKPLFFSFFTTDQLIKGINGKPMLTLRQMNGGNDICAELSIPVVGGMVTYKKNYFKNGTVDGTRSRGRIEEIDDSFGLAMLPLVQCDNPRYRIAITHDFKDYHTYKLECYHNDQPIPGVQKVERNTDNDSFYKMNVFVCENVAPEYLRLSINGNSGIILPIIKNVKTNKKIIFAVDFGTTNTHIEYTDGKNAIMSFSDNPISLWSDIEDRAEDTFEANILPLNIGEKYKFPTRTALSESNVTDWQRPVLPMAHTDISFVFGHRAAFEYNLTTTDIKWSNDSLNSLRVTSYIENFMMLMRNKVLVEGGALEDTKIIWFYPSSMSVARRNNYKTIWINAYKKYFGGDIANLTETIESIAPYEYFRRQTSISSRMVTIDIGGGTTDVVIANNGVIQYTTSFRFAADAIFGNGYADGGALNQLVAHHIDDIRQKLKNNKLDELLGVLEQYAGSNDSANMASFLFSIKDDDKVREKKVFDLLDWNGMLQKDETCKLVFLLFYSALIYHIAHIMKGKECDFPRQIAFSGNGSKVISILSPDNHTIVEYTKYIFCHVYGTEKYHPDGLEIILNDNPKPSTCKGGIYMVQNGTNNVSSGKNVAAKSLDNISFFDAEDTYDIIEKDNLKDKTIKDIRHFLDFVLNSTTKFKLKDNFGIEQQSIDTARDICYKDLDTFLNKGIDRVRQGGNPKSDPIVETLFFYPLIGILNVLSQSIYQTDINKEQ